MNNSRRMLLAVLFATVALFFVAGMAVAQDPVKLAPDKYKVLLENDRVRVLDTRLKPGEKSPMHSHPARVVYTLGDYKVRVTSPDGKTQVSEGKAGEAGWGEAVTHAGENIGTTELHLVEIELKVAPAAPAVIPAVAPVRVLTSEPPSAATPVEGTALAQDAVKVAPDIYKVSLENDRVRVLDVRMKPGDRSAMHSHPASIGYFLSDGKVRFTYPDGKTEVREPKAGVAAWSEAVTHTAENVGTTELHVVRVELKGAATPAKK